jgi:hypothetical protein
MPFADVVARLGLSTHSLYTWIKSYSKPLEEQQQDDDQHAERVVQEAIQCIYKRRVDSTGYVF